MKFRILWAMAALAWMTAGPAPANERIFCRQAAGADNPMVSGSDFGVATCDARRAPRYHSGDYASAPYRTASGDPMVWRADQWCSDLMAGYSRGYDNGYDRRFHGGEAVPQATTVVRIEIKRIIDDNAAPEAAPARRHEPALIVDGAKKRWIGSQRHAGRDWRDRTRCARTGMKILRWDGQRGVAVCPATGAWRDRLTPPPKDLATGDRG